MNYRAPLVFGLFVVGLALGVWAGRWSVEAARAQEPAGARPAVADPSPTAGAEGSGVVREITAADFAVTRVIDGDTFKVLYDGDLTSVRILDINAPERGDPRAAEATAELRRLIDGKTVTLEFGANRKRDGFGRLLCRVLIDGTDVGRHLLDAGFVEPYRPGPRRENTG